MPFVANFPLFCIVLCIFSAVVCSIVKGKIAAKVNLILNVLCLAMSAALLVYMIYNPEEITYAMGHFSAPWGNEIRFGPLEALLATVMSFVMLMVTISEKEQVFSFVKPFKINMVYILFCLTLGSTYALIYTNDIFTAYVFIEINTLCACGLVMARETGKTIAASIKYLIMSLLGSGLFLISIILLYDLTGHLLMPNIMENMTILLADGTYIVPITIIVGLLAVGIAIKSALFPFHSWITNAYDNALNGSNAISSGLILKGYIILLIKIFYRVLGLEAVTMLRVTNILFLFGFLAMILASFFAIREHSLKRMLSYSSVAQIGYIYLAIGIGTEAGFLAAFFIMIAHTLTKSMLFISAEELIKASGSKYIQDMKGSAYKNPLAATAFTIGAFSMIGFPLLSGFVSKYLLSMAGFESANKMWFVIIALIISTVLNAVYYLKVLIVIFKKNSKDCARVKNSKSFKFAAVMFITVNLALGIFYQQVIDLIVAGLKVF